MNTTTASVRDSQVFHDLVHRQEVMVAGDRAHASQLLKPHCRQADVIYLIYDKASRSHALSARQQRRNRQKASLRSRSSFLSASSSVSGATPPSVTAAWPRTPLDSLLFAFPNLYQVRKTLLAAA